MLGLINDCAEQLVITKFGIEAWHAIKASAGCTIKDYGFEQHGAYPDSATVDIVVAAAEALSVTVDDVLELFGQFFIEYTISKGYDNLLRCQGSTLRLWLSNLNAMHDHLQSSLPAGNFPVFWCENCTDCEGSIILHYYSIRGALLGSVVVGIVKEVANIYFDVEVKMDRIAVQGEEGSQCTTWRITAVDPEKRHKLTLQSGANPDEIVIRETMERRSRRRSFESKEGDSLRSSFTNNMDNMKCPFSSSMGRSPDSFHTLDSLSNNLNDNKIEMNGHKIEMNGQVQENDVGEKMSKRRNSLENMRKHSNGDKNGYYEHGLPSSKVRSVFPYHVMVNHQFKIVQMGNALPDVLMRDYDDLVGLHVDKVFKFTKPVLAGFHWPTLQRLADQKFFLALVPFVDPITGAKIEANDIKFKGNIIQIAEGGDVMFVLSPDAENISELTQMGLTMSDLPLHSFQRDVVFLGEHIASEVRTAHKLDRLSKRLENEKNLSNTLLNSMLPDTVAESLRAGKTVEPQLYEDVTLFFSDVVGFTKICDAVEPWDVIDMLNQLYTIMDHLASRFNLYKVETIGDAYMCCSGLPTPDENHAQNIANFALAVAECVQLVQSPADGTPIQLRIGIHTGHCMGGVVGTLTPHYCLFGDMVNTTARHESTSLNGKIQCSSVLYEHLAEFSSDGSPQYKFTPRGYVEMKGKGRCFTYWLENGTNQNESASPKKVKQLRSEVSKVLSKNRWKKRKYFNVRRRSSSMGAYDVALLSDDATISTDRISFIDAASEADSSVRGSTGLSDDDIFSNFDTASYSEMKRTAWLDIRWDPQLSRIDLVAAIHGLLSSMLWMCTAEVTSGTPLENKEVLDAELLRYVDRISSLYPDNCFHNWEHACQVTLSATFLVKQYHESGLVDKNPFVRFITVFAALIHDVKHLGLPNAQLQKDEHSLSVVYSQGSYLERQSIQVGIGIFVEEFPELSTSILKLCPEFINLVTYGVLATDVANSATQQTIQDRFERLINGPTPTELEQTQCVVEQILLMADVGHCSQSYENFLKWNECFFHECLNNHKVGKGFNPREGWFHGEIGFIESYILPLTERVSHLLPYCDLSSGTKLILEQWKEHGEEWTQNLVDASIQAEKAEEEAKLQEERDYEAFLAFLAA